MKTYCESGAMKYGKCCIPFYIWVWGQVADDGVASLVERSETRGANTVTAAACLHTNTY